MSENKLKRLVEVLKRLAQEDSSQSSLSDLVLAPQDLASLLGLLDQEPDLVGIISTGDLNWESASRIFGLWEQVFLSVDAQHFLLSALYTKSITPAELEQALALAYTQWSEYSGVDEICGILQTVVNDQARSALFQPSNLEYRH